MQIQLLVPGLLWPAAAMHGPAADLAVAGLDELLGRGQRQLGPFLPYHAQLAELLGLAETDFSQGSLRRLGENSPPADRDARWLCADPVNLSFNREHLLLNRFVDGELGLEESARLYRALGEVFAPLGEFEVCAANRAYLRLRAPTQAVFHALDDVVGRPVKYFLPEGKDERQWQRAMNEAQIVLHNHPLNQAREAAGQRPVNSIWLWGAGSALQTPPTTAALFQARDPLSLGFACACGIRTETPDVGRALQQHTIVVADDLHEAALQLDVTRWRAALQQLEQQWFKPLAAALRSGQLKSLALLGGGDRGTLRLSIGASARWKFWRKPYPFSQLLQSAARAPHDFGAPPAMNAPHRSR